ncbi:MAG: hypothetical protein QM756_34320 [Polyangiaceae bacterium]
MPPVRDVLLGALSIYAIDEQHWRAFSRTLIMTQDLCEVCAVSLDDVKSGGGATRSRNSNVDIVCLKPTRLTEVFDDVQRVAAALRTRTKRDRCCAKGSRRALTHS